ncbi:MAG: RidA family protein [Pseudomonadota bacterium]
MRRKIYSGSAFEELAGYARAVVDDDWIFVSGTTGYDYATGDISPDAVEQTRQCFRNISEALERAGSSLADVVRVVIYIVEQDDFEAIARVVGEHFRDIRPANTTVICALTKPEMKVEIEVTARRQTTG